MIHRADEPDFQWCLYVDEDGAATEAAPRVTFLPYIVKRKPANSALITHDLKAELVQFAAGRWTAENMRGLNKGGTTNHVESAHHTVACLWSKAYYPGNGMGYEPRSP